MLELESYVHITSPIRRLVDLLNIMILQEKEGLYQMSEKARKFYNYWTNESSLKYFRVKMFLTLYNFLDSSLSMAIEDDSTPE